MICAGDVAGIAPKSSKIATVSHAMMSRGGYGVIVKTKEKH